jgi:hypothetical protein
MAGQDVKAVQGLLNARFHELHRDRYRIKVDGDADPASPSPSSASSGSATCRSPAASTTRPTRRC